MNNPLFSWARRSAVGYEVSSKGDSRFSAMFAKMYDSRTIEAHYQCDVKGYDPGGTDWRLGKRKPPKISYTADELYEAYRNLWVQWSMNNPMLIVELYKKAAENGYVLTDMFANSPVNQARALSDILNHPSVALFVQREIMSQR